VAATDSADAATESRTSAVAFRGGELALDDIPFNGRRAYAFLKRICDLGPRVSGSEAMRQQQKMLARHFSRLGGKVRFQRFSTIHPLPSKNAAEVPLANLIVEWHPNRRERVIVCAHYDTRPYPDRDRKNPRGVFLGANDGASGVAVLTELAYHMPKLPGHLGVDFVLFDAEEFCFFNDRRDIYFLGSQHFATDYVKNPPRDYYYRGAVLLDMVGDRELQIYQEKYSLSWLESRPMIDGIWGTAKQLGVREFIPRPRHKVRDDHLPLRNTARIPAVNVIDFDFPRPGARSYWHTTKDTPDKCSALSLAKVGWVMHEWLKRVR